MYPSTHESDTIAAIATPQGKGAISIVKISGKRSLSILEKIFSGNLTPRSYPRRMLYGRILDSGTPIDKVLACHMKSPHTYTGEDIVEIQSHGGYAAAENILALVMKHGARLAGPGEFTRRAFMNGKIDLAQAEAVLEIVSAENDAYLKRAEQLLDGALSKTINEIMDNIKECLSFLEYIVDFQEQEQEVLPKNEISKRISQSKKQLTRLISSYKVSARIKRGITVVLAGNVNTGKSSLFNTLLSRKRAIVHSTPGTTRDWIEEKIELKGIPINLIDTAGIRANPDEIEREGVRGTEKLLASADIIVHLHSSDDTDSLNCISSPPAKNTFHVLSKADLLRKQNRPRQYIAVSSKTREGIDELVEEITKRAHSFYRSPSFDSPVIVERHRKELSEARKNLSCALSALDTWSEEILSYELAEAIRHLEAIVGKHIDLNVLDTIFSCFCVGK